jgi:uncharacterized protein (TIGR02145 family)
MQKITIILSILLGYTLIASAQGVGINEDNSTADPSAILDAKSTTKGVLHPRMTEAERDAISAPATGLLIFQTDGTMGLYYYSGAAWTPAHTGVTAFHTTVVPVTNPITGKTWMDRNLGASQAATSSSDAASYGDLYQWGRGTDGHERRVSAVISTSSASDNPGHGAFITTFSDWRSGQNAGLWQGVNGTNNPCPGGYRLPTDTELSAELASWGSGNNNAAGAFTSLLKLPMAGYRYASNGSLFAMGVNCGYWSSTVSGTQSHYLTFNSTTGLVKPGGPAAGFSVRCIKD